MAFLTKYWAVTANKIRKDICFLKACFFQMKPNSLLFHAYLGIMQSLYNSDLVNKAVSRRSNILIIQIIWSKLDTRSGLERFKVQGSRLTALLFFLIN